MTWDRPMAVMVVINSQAISDSIPKEGRLKCPRTIDLGDYIASTEMKSERLLYKKKGGTTTTMPSDPYSPI